MVRACVSFALHWLKGADIINEMNGTHMRYKVKLIRSEEGISIHVPALPGCWSEGADEKEAIDNIRDAIIEYLAALDDEESI